MFRFLALSLMLASLAGAQQIEIKMATLAPDGSPWHKVLERIGERWRVLSNGAVRLHIFAGGTLPLELPNCTGDNGGLPTGTPPTCLNVSELSKWLRNPPAVLPMAATPNADGMYRGMPDLGLSESQIASLVAYLSTLK